MAALALVSCPGPTPVPDRPNIVLITLESLRPDHVGAYGGRAVARPDVPLTPAIDALAAEAVVYDDAQAVTSWTLAAHASIFTGLYPTAHQTTRPKDRLDDSYTTLAEILGDEGYQTVGVVSGPYLRKNHNLSQGFELYDDSISAGTNREAHGDVTNPQMEAALERFFDEQRDPARPFFLFAYYWDPHYDYIPPRPYKEQFVDASCEFVDVTNYGFEENAAVHAGINEAQLRYVLSQYDGEIRWTDDHLDRLFQRLKQEGLWDNTAIIVTADHGEEFFEHGKKGHKNNLYAPSVHVPLIVKYPQSSRTGRDGRLVSQVDLLPSILDIAETTARPVQQGRSFLAAPSEDRAVFYELTSLWYFEYPEKHTRVEEWRGVRRGPYKLVWTEEGARELFNVIEDPGEEVNLAADRAEELDELLRDYRGWAEQSAALAESYSRGGEAELTEEELERLRSLGYVGP